MMVVMAKHCVLVCLCMCMEERGISRRLELCPSTKWPPSAPIGGLASNQVATNGIWGMRPSPLKSPRISHISCFFIASAPEASIFTHLFSTKPIFSQLFSNQPIFTQLFSTQPIFTRIFFTQPIFTRIFWAFSMVQTGILYEPRERAIFCSVPGTQGMKKNLKCFARGWKLSKAAWIFNWWFLHWITCNVYYAALQHDCDECLLRWLLRMRWPHGSPLCKGAFNAQACTDTSTHPYKGTGTRRYKRTHIQPAQKRTVEHLHFQRHTHAQKQTNSSLCSMQSDLSSSGENLLTVEWEIAFLNQCAGSERRVCILLFRFN